MGDVIGYSIKLFPLSDSKPAEPQGHPAMPIAQDAR
jgi:hypothetical protein